MRIKVIRTLALALLVSAASIVLGQQFPKDPGDKGAKAVYPPKQGGSPPGSSAQKTSPEKSKLEEMLAEALRNNPDIRVAAAKLAEAEAELNRTRIQVTQKIVSLHAAITSKKVEVAYREKESRRYQALLADKAIDARLADEVQDKLLLAKAQLEELEAQLPGLLGKVAHGNDNDRGQAVNEGLFNRLMVAPLYAEVDLNRRRQLWLDVMGALPSPSQLRQVGIGGSMAEKLRKALQTPVKVDYKDVAVSDLLKDLEKKAPGLSLHIRDVPQRMLPMKAQPMAPGGKGPYSQPPFPVEEVKLSLHFDMPLPVAAVLQAIEDNISIHFIVRDYGILVTTGAIPPGAITVQEFMRQKPDSNKHKEARHFIHDVWPKLDSASLEDKIPTAHKAFQTCMDVGDRDSIRDMLGVTLGHVTRLRNRRSELHPELVIDDEKETKQLEKVGEKLAKLVADMQFCLKEWER